MKNYKDLSKEEKKELKKELLLDKEESKVYRKSNKMIILCIVGIILAIASSIFDYIYSAMVVSYVLDGLLFVFSILVMIRMIMIRKQILNSFLNRKK